MTRDDVFRMAAVTGCEARFRVNGGVELVGADVEWLERFAKLVAAEEREECAKLCHTLWYAGWNSPDDAAKCADAIRARGMA